MDVKLKPTQLKGSLSDNSAETAKCLFHTALCLFIFYFRRNEQFNSEISDCIRHESTVMVTPSKEKNGSLKGNFNYINFIIA